MRALPPGQPMLCGSHEPAFEFGPILGQRAPNAKQSSWPKQPKQGAAGMRRSRLTLRLRQRSEHIRRCRARLGAGRIRDEALHVEVMHPCPRFRQIRPALGRQPRVGRRVTRRAVEFADDDVPLEPGRNLRVLFQATHNRPRIGGGVGRSRASQPDKTSVRDGPSQRPHGASASRLQSAAPQTFTSTLWSVGSCSFNSARTKG